MAFQEAIYARCGNQCERCHALGPIHAHHLKPRSRGGKHDPANGAGLCWRCHGAVHDHTADDWKEWIL